MAKQLINLGQADKGNGDPLRVAFDKVNDNFAELYSSVIATGVASTSTSPPLSPGEGDLWWNTNDGNLYVYYSGVWTSASAVQGPEGDIGPQGAQGPAGIRGPKGDAGDIGPAGLNGAQGPQGPQGLRGVKGDKGDTGEAGPAGVDGADGAQGPQGIRGLKGDDGAQGLQGLKGDTGATGAQGPQGLRGLRGDTGAQGEQGEQGPRGLAGTNGAQGPQGEQGDPGTQVQFSLTAPNPVTEGNVWWNMNDGNLYVHYNNQWVSAVSIAAPEVNTGNIEFRNDSMNDINGILITNASQSIQPTASVTIPANDSGAPLSINNDDKIWSFGAEGKLTLPAGTTYQYFNTPLTGYGDGLARLDFSLATDGVSAQWLAASASPAGSGYSIGDTFTFDAEFLGIPGASVTIEVLTVGPGGSVEDLAFSMPPLYPADIYRDSPINLQVGPESNRWTFGADGTLTLPGDLNVGSNSIREDGLFSQQFSIAAGAGKRVEISSNDGEKVWSFDTTGALTFPDGAIIDSFQASTQIETWTAGVTNMSPTNSISFFGHSSTSFDTTWTISGSGITGQSAITAINPIMSGMSITGYTVTIEQTISTGLVTGDYVFSNPPITQGVNLSSDLSTWTFGTDGNLTLPSGFITSNEVTGVNLRSGYDVSIISNHMDVDQEWIFGSDGQLTVPGQIRKDGGLYLNSGGTGVSSTVFVNGTAGSVILRTDNGTTLKSLTLDVDGVLTLPNNTTISNDLAGEYSDTFLCLTWGYTGGEAGLFSSNNITRPFSNPSVANVTVGWYISGPLLNGVKQITDIVEQGDGDRAFVVDLTDGSAWADLNITIPYRFYSPDYALVYNGTRLTVDSNEWNFTQAGDLTIPGNINEKVGNGLEISVHNNRNNDGTPGNELLSLTNNDAVNGQTYTKLNVGAYNIELSTDYSGVFTGARRTWEFDRDGVLTFPDSTAYTGKGITVPVDQSLTVNLSFDSGPGNINTSFKVNPLSIKLPTGNGNIFSNGETAAERWSLDSANKTFYFPDAGDGVSPQIRYSTPGNDGMQLFTAAKPIKITTASNTNWTFGTTGTLTLPASGDIVDSTGVSQLANRAKGTFPLQLGSTTTTFTFDFNATYTMWLRAVVDNGVIAYNATFTITNANLPVLGQQQAYAFSGAGTVLDFTSLPNQIVGTSGSVTRSPTILGTPANQFTFVIQNDSGEVVDLHYGYTKI